MNSNLIMSNHEKINGTREYKSKIWTTVIRLGLRRQSSETLVGGDLNHGMKVAESAQRRKHESCEQYH